MENEQYHYMAEAESQHWWYVGCREIFLDLLKRHNIIQKGSNVLDAGCGTGYWLEFLKKRFDVNAFGIEQNHIALEYATTRNNLNIIAGDVNVMLFPENTLDLITCFDVLYHRNVSDEMTLNNFYKYLNAGGHLLLTVPAYQMLYSRHDEVIHTKKRYTRKQVEKLLHDCGFEIVKSTYIVHFLFPLAVVKRLSDKIFRKHSAYHNEVKVPSQVINRFFLSIMRLEKKILKYLSFPFGLTVLVLAVKKNNH